MVYQRKTRKMRKMRKMRKQENNKTRKTRKNKLGGSHVGFGGVTQGSSFYPYGSSSHPSQSSQPRFQFGSTSLGQHMPGSQYTHDSKFGTIWQPGSGTSKPIDWGRKIGFTGK